MTRWVGCSDPPRSTPQARRDEGAVEERKDTQACIYRKKGALQGSSSSLRRADASKSVLLEGHSSGKRKKKKKGYRAYGNSTEPTANQPAVDSQAGTIVCIAAAPTGNFHRGKRVSLLSQSVRSENEKSLQRRRPDEDGSDFASPRCRERNKIELRAYHLSPTRL